MTPAYQILFIYGTNQENKNAWTFSIINHDEKTKRLKITQREAISGLEKNKWSLFILKDDQKMNIRVTTNKLGKKTLVTEEGIELENLFTVPEY